MQFCQEHGLIVRAIGDAIALCPPYIVTSSDVDEIFAKLRRGLDDTLAWAKREKLYELEHDDASRARCSPRSSPTSSAGCCPRSPITAAGQRSFSR